MMMVLISSSLSHLSTRLIVKMLYYHQGVTSLPPQAPMEALPGFLVAYQSCHCTSTLRSRSSIR